MPFDDSDLLAECEPAAPVKNRWLSLGGLVTAMRMLTILPVPGPEAGRVSTSQPWFPAVGLLIGLLVLGAARCVFWMTAGWGEAAAVAAVAATVWLTRGLHLDGLADCADGFGGAFARERVLRIMKDSHVGAFGVMALVLVLMAKWVAFARIIDSGAWGWIPAALVISRTAQVTLAAAYPYARPEGGTARDFVEQATFANALIVVALACLMLLLIPGVRGYGLAGFGMGLGVAGLFGLWCRCRVGGVTGDLLGAGSELTEVLVLCVGAVLAGGQ